MSVLNQWDIDSIVDQQVYQDRPNMSLITTESEQYVLKSVGDFGSPTLTRNYKLLAHLDRHGVPVALPILSKEGNDHVEFESESYILYRWLPGETKNQQSPQAHQVFRAYGQGIANLHKALAQYSDEEFETKHFNMLERWAQLVRPRLDPECLSDINSAIAEIGKAEHVFLDIPVHLIHADCHGGNVLVDGDLVSGFVDNDHYYTGPRLYDVCYLLIGFVRYLVSDESSNSAWLSVFAEALTAYDDFNPLTQKEKGQIWHTLLAVELNMAGYQCESDSEYAHYSLDTILWLLKQRKTIEEKLPTEWSI